MILTVAGLSLQIAEGSNHFSFEYSPCHEKFLASNAGKGRVGALQKPLFFDVNNTSISPQLLLSDCLCSNEIWELWRDRQGQLVFTQPKQKPQRWVFIEPSFKRGEIVGDFPVINKKLDYPLQYLDIVIFSNWLANLGDLILHASGIALDEEGYCFIGDSGAGKSTLVRDLANSKKITILGEDQIVLRKIADQFMVFGTPWHETPEMCSPIGVPLKKIFFLNRKASEILNPIHGFDAIVRILQTAFYPVYRPEVLDGILARLATLAGEVRFFELAYKRGSDVLQEIVNA